VVGSLPTTKRRVFDPKYELPSPSSVAKVPFGNRSRVRRGGCIGAPENGD